MNIFILLGNCFLVMLFFLCCDILAFSRFSLIYDYVFLGGLIPGLGDFCYDFPYVDGRPFAGFGAFSDSFIFCYSWIAFWNLWRLIFFIAFFGDFLNLGRFLNAIFLDGPFAIWIGSISGFGRFFTIFF
jgi:hypothetical protein